MRFQLQELDISNKEKLLFPYLKKNHFMMVVLNLERNTMMFVDSYRKESDKKRAFLRMHQFLADCSKLPNLKRLGEVEWHEDSFQEIDRPYQTDGCSCGVFMIYFIESLSTNTPMTHNFDPERARPKIALKLLRKSVDMKNCCSHCWVDRECDYFVRCDFCKRWSHDRCLNKWAKTKGRTVEEWEAVTYKSVFCVVQERQFMKKIPYDIDEDAENFFYGNEDPNIVVSDDENYEFSD